MPETSFRIIACTAAMLLATEICLAQPAPDSPEPQRVIVLGGGPAMAGGPVGAGLPNHAPFDVTFADHTIAFVTAGGAAVDQPVLGAPYSAEVVMEVEQRLWDGNRIARKTSSKVYRDSNGRTRRDQNPAVIGPWVAADEAPAMAVIYDPSTKQSIILEHGTHTARVLPAANVHIAPPRAPLPLAAAGTGGRFDVRVEASGGVPAAVSWVEEHASTAPAPQPRLMPPALQVLHAGGPLKSETREELLGSQYIEGVNAEGTRQVTTIPAGAIGNERAIEIVSERWYAAELQTVVLSRHTDPRFGETVYWLTNIDRAEPAANLFEVPPGYTVVSEP